MKLSVFLTYFKACTYPMTLLLIVFYILSNVASVGSNFWLSTYSDSQASTDKNM